MNNKWSWIFFQPLSYVSTFCLPNFKSVPCTSLSYESLANWMCVQDPFSQIRSQFLLHFSNHCHGCLAISKLYLIGSLNHSNHTLVMVAKLWNYTCNIDSNQLNWNFNFSLIEYRINFATAILYGAVKIAMVLEIWIECIGVQFCINY